MLQFTAEQTLRAHEIWQYIHVITTAASTYVWENVLEYDVTFRQLMSQYPNRNWGKIYTQMWNLAMKEPIAKFMRYGNVNQSNNRQTEGKNREKILLEIQQEQMQK